MFTTSSTVPVNVSLIVSKCNLYVPTVDYTLSLFSLLSFSVSWKSRSAKWFVQRPFYTYCITTTSSTGTTNTNLLITVTQCSVSIISSMTHSSYWLTSPSYPLFHFFILCLFALSPILVERYHYLHGALPSAPPSHFPLDIISRALILPRNVCRVPIRPRHLPRLLICFRRLTADSDFSLYNRHFFFFFFFFASLPPLTSVYTLLVGNNESHSGLVINWHKDNIDL